MQNEMSMILVQYIRPELFILVFALYFIGVMLKKTPHVLDHFIPIILGCTGIALCAIYILSVSPTPVCYQEVLSMIFTIIIQGILCAAAAVYANQIYKQYLKMKEYEVETKQE